MARKNEFRPDRSSSGLLNKLYLTKSQRQTFLKWLLYSLLVLVLSVTQDVVLSQFTFLGVTTDLVPFGIMLICLLEGTERGCIFTLLAACFYLFSGAPGNYCLPYVTVIAVGVTLFRQSYLSNGFSTTLLCLVVAITVYELMLAFTGIVLSLAGWDRVPGFLLTALLTVLTVPVLYPAGRAIAKIGGESWKE